MGRLGARAVVVILALAVAAMAGCGTLNTVKNTYVQVQFSGEDMLHVAVIPRTLPDGTPAAKQRDALLKDVANLAGGYTLIPSVMTTWKPKGSAKEAMNASDDLLLVEGPAVLGAALRQRLHDDFGQPSPFVLSLPIQNVHVAAPHSLPLAKPATGAKAPTEKPAQAAPPKK